MDGRWDLSTLYSGFDDPAYAADRQELSGLMADYRARVSALGALERRISPAEAAEMLEAEERMWVLGANLKKFTFLRQSADAGDTEAANNMAALKKLFGSAACESALLTRLIAACPISEADFEACGTLRDYRFHISELKADGEHLLETSAEEVMGRMQACAGGAWEDLRGYLTAYAHAPLDGRELTLTQLRALQDSGDATVRKAAFEAEIECSRTIAPGLAFALCSIKEQMNLTAELRGYESIMELTLEKSRMSQGTLDALWEAVRGALPKFHAYLRRKAELLGHENGLPWYDLRAPLGASGREFTEEGAREYLVDKLGGFSADLGEMVDRAFREHWIDFYARPGKTGGAFCCNMPNQCQSRVLTNFNGSLDGVVTIAHELGHAYHGQQISSHRPLNREYTMPVAETASNFNETIVMNAAIAEAEGGERLALIEQRLQDFTQTICDIYSRFLFERAVFEERKGGFLFPERLCELMADAQKEAYGDGLDPACLHPYMWVNKVHYYYTHISFYNFPYAFGTLFSLGLYARWQREGEAFAARYRELLRATTVSSVEQAAAMAGVDVSRREFWDESLAGVCGLIDEFLELTER